MTTNTTEQLCVNIDEYKAAVAPFKAEYAKRCLAAQEQYKTKQITRNVFWQQLDKERAIYMHKTKGITQEYDRRRKTILAEVKDA